jgi:hypothetical protein
MANQITKIIIRNGTDLQRRTANITGITFNLSEPAYCTDTQRLYIGNGAVGGIPVSTRNLGRVDTLFGSYLQTGFSEQAYIAFTSQGAEVGDIIFDASTRTLYSLSSRSNFATSEIPAVSDLVKYDASTLINAIQFYYDSDLKLNLETQGVAVTNLNSNVIDGITLTKPTPATPISIALGSVSNGVGIEHLKHIQDKSLYINSKNDIDAPMIQHVGPGQVVGRTFSSTLTSISINQILNTASYTAGPGLIITSTPESVLFDLDPLYISCGNQFYINRNTSLNGNLSCINSIATGNAGVSGSFTVGGSANIIGPLRCTSSVTTGNAGVSGNFTTNGNAFIDGNTTLGNANTDTTIIRGITKIADSSATNGILFGSGDANYDTNLYRSAAVTLKTDDNFIVDLNLNVNGSTTLGNTDADATIIRGITKIADSSATNGILFGANNTSYDTNLYRSDYDELKTDDSLIVNLDLSVNGNTTLGNTNADTTIIRGITKIADSSQTNGILFGSGDANYDTNLYRSAAVTLKTDDNFIVDLNLTVNGNASVGGNTTLGNANADATIIRGTTKIADSSSARGILFGSGDTDYDTNLYRSAANTLRTDDNFIVAGNLNVSGSTNITGNLDVTGLITSPTFGALKNMASFASPRINAGTIPLFRATYDIQIITTPSVNATGGTPTFSPAITNGTTIAAGTLVSLVAGTSLTNVSISFGYKYT